MAFRPETAEPLSALAEVLMRDTVGLSPTERELIGWYENLVAALLPRLDADNIERFADIAALPMQIRGYGPVKEAAAEKVKQEVRLAAAVI